MTEIVDFIIHLFIYFSFAGLLIHMLMKIHVIEDISNDIFKIKNKFEILDGRLLNLVNSVNNKLMIDESKTRAAVIDIKAEEKTII